ncbi:MAG: hypothetical protein ACRDPY_32110 [Streptosporangiaceae bacterium]
MFSAVLGRAERANCGDQDRPMPGRRELPDPDERSRAYEATRAYFSEQAALRAEDRRDGHCTPAYRDEVPGFLDKWARHLRHWPEKPRAAADRPADPPETREAIGRLRDAEPTFSADAQAIEQENKDKHGGWLEGFEHRRKGEDRLGEKIAEQLEVEPGTTATEALREVPDGIRYTYCFQPESYTRGYYDIKERFESRGYDMYYSQNWWTNPEYKGINTRWVASDGQRFEVQFHTPDSFHAKHHVTHTAYERIRDPTTSDQERAELREFQREVPSWIRVPDGAAGIPDYRKKGF